MMGDHALLCLLTLTLGNPGRCSKRDAPDMLFETMTRVRGTWARCARLPLSATEPILLRSPQWRTWASPAGISLRTVCARGAFTMITPVRPNVVGVRRPTWRPWPLGIGCASVVTTTAGHGGSAETVPCTLAWKRHIHQGK